jgi:hypothetical protein
MISPPRGRRSAWLRNPVRNASFRPSLKRIRSDRRVCRTGDDNCAGRNPIQMLHLHPPRPAPADERVYV